MYLTEYELQMMHVLWRSDAPITSTEILRRSVNKEWKDNSLHPMLQRLQKKGFIREVGIIRDGRAFARTFEAAIGCGEYYLSFLTDAAQDAGLPMLFSALIRNSQITESTLAQLEHALAEKRRGLEENGE